jgi:hypothetical protein
MCCSLLLLHLQLTQQLSAAEAAARVQLQQVEAQHRAELEELSAGHAARVELLRGELAADATTAKKAETRMQVCCSMLTALQSVCCLCVCPLVCLGAHIAVLQLALQLLWCFSYNDSYCANCCNAGAAARACQAACRSESSC